MSGSDREQHDRKKLNQPDQPQLHGGSGSFVNFPADRDLLHLLAEHEHKVAGEISSITGQSKRCVRIVPFGDGRHLAEYFWYQLDSAPGPTRAITTSTTYGLPSLVA